VVISLSWFNKSLETPVFSRRLGFYKSLGNQAKRFAKPKCWIKVIVEAPWLRVCVSHIRLGHCKELFHSYSILRRERHDDCFFCIILLPFVNSKMASRRYSEQKLRICWWNMAKCPSFLGAVRRTVVWDTTPLRLAYDVQIKDTCNK